MKKNNNLVLTKNFAISGCLWGGLKGAYEGYNMAYKVVKDINVHNPPGPVVIGFGVITYAIPSCVFEGVKDGFLGFVGDATYYLNNDF